MQAHASCAKEHHLKAPGDDLLTLILLGWETNEWRTRRDTDLSKVAIKWKWAQYTGQQLEQFLMTTSMKALNTEPLCTGTSRYNFITVCSHDQHVMEFHQNTRPIH